MNLSRRDVAHVLHAIRMLQEEMTIVEESKVILGMHDEEIEGMTLEELDNLCERINTMPLLNVRLIGPLKTIENIKATCDFKSDDEILFKEMTSI